MKAYLLHRLVLRLFGVPMPDAGEIGRFVDLWFEAHGWYES